MHWKWSFFNWSKIQNKLTKIIVIVYAFSWWYTVKFLGSNIQYSVCFIWINIDRMDVSIVSTPEKPQLGYWEAPKSDRSNVPVSLMLQFIIYNLLSLDQWVEVPGLWSFFMSQIEYSQYWFKSFHYFLTLLDMRGGSRAPGASPPEKCLKCLIVML